MNTKKILVLLLMLIIYVNYVLHFKKDIKKLEANIINVEQRIKKEEILFKEKDKYKDINSTKDYTYLFYNGENLSYSAAMGAFQQDIQSFAKEAKCTLLNTQWQEMPTSKDRWYDTLRLRLSLKCTPKAFIDFQNRAREKSKLLVFNQIHFLKDRRKSFLHISATISSYMSKKNEK